MTILVGCGSKGGGGSAPDVVEPSEVVEQVIEAPKSLSLDTKEELPACGEDNLSQLAYVASEAVFYDCGVSGWETVEIGPEAPFVASELYWSDTSFSADILVDDADTLALGVYPTSALVVTVGEIVHVTVSVIILAEDSGGDLFSTTFSHSFTASRSSASSVVPISDYSDVNLLVGVSGSKVTFAVDTDGNLGNSLPVSFDMSEL
jgi:hypothetical protein